MLMGRKRMKRKYKNIYFVNGTAYAGKSTLCKVLASKYQGILCGENYTSDYFPNLDYKEFPNLTYTKRLSNFSEFVRRTPTEYKEWIDGCSKEAEKLELKILSDLEKENKMIFVDTNISLETLKEISDKDHVIIMLASQDTSVNRFFEREDKEKQFIYSLLLKEEDSKKALDNYRECLKLINSKEIYEKFLNSGFNVILRDENRTIDETLSLAEKFFKLKSDN